MARLCHRPEWERFCQWVREKERNREIVRERERERE